MCSIDQELFNHARVQTIPKMDPFAREKISPPRWFSKFFKNFDKITLGTKVSHMSLYRSSARAHFLPTRDIPQFK